MAANPPAAPQTEAPLRLVLVSIGLLLLLASLDQTIVSTALPTIVADLGGVDHLSWVVTAYVLTSTIAAPLYGKLGDLYGRRKMVFLSVGLFLAGSILCGVAGSMMSLIASRALQGLGGGGLFVLALSVVGDVVPPRERGKVQGVFAAVFSVSSVVGPLAGGWLVQYANWHWIFFINIPIGAIAVAGFASGFKPKGIRTKHKIDYVGALLLSLGLGALTLVTSLGGRSIEWASPQALGMIALSVASFAAFVWVENRAEEPILPLSLFRMNVFWVTSVIGFITGVALFGAITFLPLYLQIAKGVTPTVSGLQLIPMTAGILVASTLSGRYMGKTGRYSILPKLGMSMLAGGMLLLSFLSQTTTPLVFSLSLTLVGLGMGCIFPVVTTSVQNAVPKAQMGTATAAGIMLRQTGASLGVAAFGAIFAARMAEGVMGDHSGFNPATLSQLAPEARDALAEQVVFAIHPIYLIAMVLALVGLAFAFLLEEVQLTNRQVPRGE